MSRRKSTTQAAQQSEVQQTQARETVLVRKNNGAYVATSPEIAARLVGNGRAMYADSNEASRREQRLAERSSSKASESDADKASESDADKKEEQA